MMRLLIKLLAVFALLAMSGFRVVAEDDDTEQFKARLTGLQQVPPILSDGKGTFTASLNMSGTTLSYTLTFSGMATAAGQAHIHFAQPEVNGNIVAFLCGGGGKPACPPTGGTVTGTITASDILGVPAQGVTAGDFAGFLRIIQSGESYVNVHTVDHPAGEIRGQLRGGD